MELACGDGTVHCDGSRTILDAHTGATMPANRIGRAARRLGLQLIGGHGDNRAQPHWPCSAARQRVLQHPFEMMRTMESNMKIGAKRLEDFRAAVLDSSYVSLGSRRTSNPHEFYRYPARFTPGFARSAITAFTRRGDLVLDPFVGGGTTLIEARLAGRLAIGSDLNPLAVFVSRIKSRPHSKPELDAVSSWIDRLPSVLSTRGRLPIDEWTSEGYFRNIDTEQLAGVRSALSRARTSLETIYPPGAEKFARCVVLRAGQWALDMRIETPSRNEFTERLTEMGHAMIDAASDYRRQVRVVDQSYDAAGWQRTRVMQQALPGLANRLTGQIPPPKLILTSPPYPGVYVNYHRWKVLGRRETPAPFWLADRRDGNGQSFYTMSARSDSTLTAYFKQLRGAFSDLAKIADRRTVMVQMVGFHNPKKDLPRYLQTMEDAGFTEVIVPDLGNEAGRLWRDVPNRRWWVQDGTKGVHTAREVVLVHQKSG